jgi:diamine N-acetyltransferase
MIEFRPITPENYQECIKLSVFESQRTYVATNQRSLADAYVYRDIVLPYALFADEVMVGFLMMIPDPKELETMWIWRLMIDQRYQHRGYGKAAMMKAIADTKNTQRFKSIKLDFVPTNLEGKTLYENLGFTPTGEIDDGEVVMILNL